MLTRQWTGIEHLGTVKHSFIRYQLIMAEVLNQAKIGKLHINMIPDENSVSKNLLKIFLDYTLIEWCVSLTIAEDIHLL